MDSSAVLSTPASFVHLRWTNGGWILIVLLFNRVYCQERERISVFAGSDILLQCFHEPDPSSPSSDINVFWRYEDIHTLYDILHGIPDLSAQLPRFRDRTRPFPDLYSQGNFSLVLTNVSLSDAGPYKCVIPQYDHIRRLQLIVTVKATEKPPTGPPSEASTKQPTEPKEEGRSKKLGVRSGSNVIVTFNVKLTMALSYCALFFLYAP